MTWKCKLFGCDWYPRPTILSADEERCLCNCSRCCNTKWIDFREYSIYVGLTTIYDSGVISRDAAKTFQDPWGKKKVKKVLDQMNAWKAAGYPTEGM